MYAKSKAIPLHDMKCYIATYFVGSNKDSSQLDAPGRFFHRERTACGLQTEGWVGAMADLDVLDGRKLLGLTGNLTPDLPASSLITISTGVSQL